MVVIIGIVGERIERLDAIDVVHVVSELQVQVVILGIVSGMSAVGVQVRLEIIR
jgi:hypothetical protein